MANNLLSDVLNGLVGLDTFYKWISGKETQEINISLNKTDFILFIIYYIQEEANKFISANSAPCTQSKVHNESKPKETVSEKKTSESEQQNQGSESPQRTPFQIINRTTPTKGTKQSFARYLHYENDNRSNIFNCSTNQDIKNILTSTPVHPRKNSGHDQTIISPRSSGSIFSDHSSLSPTTHSSRSSATKVSSTNSSCRFSPHSNSPVSPSSPNYTDSFPNLGTRNRHWVPQSPCLADFITTKPTSQKNRKRIKPTQLTSNVEKASVHESKELSSSFGTVNRPFVPLSVPILPHSEMKEKEALNFDEERNLLKQKRRQSLNTSVEIHNKILTSSSKTIKVSGFDERTSVEQKQCQSPRTSTETSSNLDSSTLVLVEPDPSLVTCVDKVSRLATVYSMCLDKNLVPNITSEIYLVFSMLITNYRSSQPQNDNLVSDSLTNSNSSDKQCIAPLQNLNLEEAVIAKIPNEKNKLGSTSSVLVSVHNCVKFAAFVIEKQIHLLQNFEKGIIRLLIENHRLRLFAPHLIPQLIHIAELKETGEVSSQLIKNSFVTTNGPVLYQTETDSRDNFSSLLNFNMFKKQRDGFYEILHDWRSNNSDNLFITRKFPNKVKNILDHSSDPVNMMHLARLFCTQLTSSNIAQCESELELPGVTKDKLSRLQARFIKPQELNSSPRPAPHFPNEQQFYQLFIQNASDSVFLAHVVDCLVQRIAFLDGTNFFADGLSIEDIKSNIKKCVSDCCLLAKFLGYIVFLPYRSDTPTTPNTLQAQLFVRQLMVPPINVAAYLQRALVTNRLVVTVPWIVAFLGMMDSVTPHLLAYHMVLQLLVSIYCALPLHHISSHSSLLLRCSLGWLFDVSFFPESVFYSLVASSLKLESKTLEPGDVDVRDIVDQALLAELCPYLSHLRVLLSTSSTVKRGTARHITPVPAQLTPVVQATIAQTAEMQLEESFLNAQPASFRTTLETVVDRISSACIKHVCSNVIAHCKEEASAAIYKQNEEKQTLEKKEIQSFLMKCCQTTEAKIETEIAEHCGPKIETVLPVLLGLSASDPPVLRSALAISGRRCRERIVNWLNSHINLSELFSKLISSAKPSGEGTIQPVENKTKVEHLDTTLSPSEILIEMQERLCQCIESRGVLDLNEEHLINLIESALETVQFRSDLVVVSTNMICALTIDYCIALLAYHPRVVTSEVLQKLCQLWSLSTQPGGHERLERILSARNILLLCQAGPINAKLSWRHLSNLLVQLLKDALLTPKQLETQCVALFRQDWPPMVLTFMGACLTSVLDQIKHDPICEQNPKFLLTLEWVNEMAEDLARGDVFDDM